MGSSEVLSEQGFLRVSSSMHYDSTKGYGWLRAPISEFEIENPKLYKQTLRSGVLGLDSLIFRADVDAGDYYVTLQLGNGGSDSSHMKMRIVINNETLSDTVSLPWYRLNYKTIRHKVTLNDKRIDIKVIGLGTKVGLHAVEIRPVVLWKNFKETHSIEQDTNIIRNFRYKLTELLESNHNDIHLINQLDIIDKYLLACRYYDGGGWLRVVKETGLSMIYRMYAAADLLEQIVSDPTDPLYDRAMYLLARVYYWLDQEDDNPMHYQKAIELFTQLKKKYNNNSLLRMYGGERLPHIIKDDVLDTNNNAPEWAMYQREAMHRMLELIHWWVQQRQAPNGELGGKYGDDVEMLRWWMPAILGADDSIAKVGYTRLADGVWNSEVLDRGFSKKMDDVEHSSELFRDTHAGIFLMKYGDPEYVERCMIGMQHFRDVWTGITSLGHRHFKSYYLSSTEVNTSDQYGIDVALNARALLPGLWMTWYNKNPHLMQLFSEWCSAWMSDAARTANGKPLGIMPSAVAFNGDRIGGNSKQWYKPHLTYDYYNWDHLAHVNELLYHLLGMYSISRNEKYLETINFYKHLLLNVPQYTWDTKAVKEGSLEWVQMQLLQGGQDWGTLHPMGRLFGMARQITRRYDYDSLVQKYGSPYNKYLISKDTAQVVQGLVQILESLRFNFPLLTSEVKFTDRVYVPGSSLLTGMYTGHFGAGYEFPALAVSWKHTGPNVSVFLQNETEKSFSALLYNFDKEKKIGARTWQLQPGLYKIALKETNNIGSANYKSLEETTVAFHERVNDFWVTIPSNKTVLLEVTQLESFETLSFLQPDVAIAARDVELVQQNNNKFLKVKVHNIGSENAVNCKIVLSVSGREIVQKIIPFLPAPNNLRPQSKLFFLPVKSLRPGQEIMIRVDSNVKEITLLNNCIKGIVEVDGINWDK